MSNYTNFTKINFKNEPSTATPLSAGNLNSLQTNIGNSFKFVFGSSAVTNVSDPDTQYYDGVYNISVGGGNYPFTVENAWGVLIVLVKANSTLANGDRITQIAIDNDNHEVWIRYGRWSTSRAKLDFTPAGAYNWTKLKDILQINTDNTITKTNIKIGDKEVYVKRLTVASLANNGTVSIPTGITDNITPYKVEGMVLRSVDGVYFPIPYGTDGVAAIGINYNSTTKTVSIIDYADRTNCSGYVDFYFTYDN